MRGGNRRPPRPAGLGEARLVEFAHVVFVEEAYGVESAGGFVNRGVMADLDWSQCPAGERIPGKASGAWLFRDTRMPVSIVFENLEAAASIDESPLTARPTR